MSDRMAYFWTVIALLILLRHIILMVRESEDDSGTEYVADREEDGQR